MFFKEIVLKNQIMEVENGWSQIIEPDANNIRFCNKVPHSLTLLKMRRKKLFFSEKLCPSNKALQFLSERIKILDPCAKIRMVYKEYNARI